MTRMKSQWKYILCILIYNFKIDFYFKKRNYISNMYLINRKGESVELEFDKITRRNKSLAYGLNIDTSYLSQLVIKGLATGMRTDQIDELSAETACSLISSNIDYDTLAARIVISNLHKNTNPSFIEVMKNLSDVYDENVFIFAHKHKDIIEKTIDCSRDYNYGYFGFKTLEKTYLLKKDGKILERPQYLLMRVALGIHIDNYNKEFAISRVIDTYNEMSLGKFTHATPTLFNAGTIYPALSSCFLLGMNDSVESMYECIKRCALISKHSGGIGINISNIRAKGSTIRSSGGSSEGIIPMIRVFNDTARHITQGGKRKGSIAAYLEPWHPEILEFLELRLNNGKEELRARDIFIALWVPDMFMKKVEENGMWYLFCPHTIFTEYGKGLQDVYGQEFEDMYHDAVNKKLYFSEVKAHDVWTRIITSQIETGLPYIMYKDSVNSKSNQKNIGIIRGSNLCVEVVQYTDPDHVSVCNLASIALPKFVIDADKRSTPHDFYNFAELGHITEIIVENLNNVIDKTFYPVPEARTTNLKHRPIGIGVQGLADVFAMLKYSWDSLEAADLNKRIFETIYYHAVKKSAELAEIHGSYELFDGSPTSMGILQYDMWNVKPITSFDWDGLKIKVQKGMRNSLLIAPMPTASTAQILGNNEAFEPFTSNIYSRKVISGDFTVINKYLYRDLKEIGLCTKDIINKIILAGGSIQSIDSIPSAIKNIYKTVWEISQKTLIDMAVDRGPFIDQSQSLNLFIAKPTMSKLSSMHLYSWKRGSKNGIYYLRSKPATEAVKFSIMKEEEPKKVIEDTCISCGS